MQLQEIIDFIKKYAIDSEYGSYYGMAHEHNIKVYAFLERLKNEKIER